MNQRWRQGRESYRPAGETIDTRLYDVAPMSQDREAKTFVESHHYSHSYPAARFRYGLYQSAQLVGVAVFNHPCNDLAISNVLKCSALDGVELGRFVLLDSVPANGETWFLARCFEHLRREPLAGAISFSDPTPRRTTGGVIVHRGHIGTIYQAFNGVYLGRSTPRTLHLLPDGNVFSARTIQKIRKMERGWRYAAAILEKFGASPLAGDPGEWLSQWLPHLTRTMRHQGNHRYAWPLTRATRKILSVGLPYPKEVTLQ